MSENEEKSLESGSEREWRGRGVGGSRMHTMARMAPPHQRKTRVEESTLQSYRQNERESDRTDHNHNEISRSLFLSLPLARVAPPTTIVSLRREKGANEIGNGVVLEGTHIE